MIQGAKPLCSGSSSDAGFQIHFAYHCQTGRQRKNMEELMEQVPMIQTKN